MKTSTLTLYCFPPQGVDLLGRWIAFFCGGKYCHSGFAVDNIYYEAILLVVRRPRVPDGAIAVKSWAITNGEAIGDWADNQVGDEYSVGDLFAMPLYRLFPRLCFHFKNRYICSELATDAIRKGILESGKLISICGDIPAQQIDPCELAAGALKT